MSFKEGFLDGFFTTYRGFKVFKRHKSLWSWFLLPFLLDFVILLLIVFLGFWILSLPILSFPILSFSTLSFFSYWIFPFVKLTLFFVLFFLFFYSFYSLHTLVASPFYSLLAENTLRKEGFINQKFSLMQSLLLVLKMTWASLIKIFIFSVFFLFILFFSFFFSFLSWPLLFWPFFVLAYDSMDYSFEVLGKNFFQRLSFLKQYFPFFLGLGFFLCLANLLPVLGPLLAFPFSVSGSAGYFKKIGFQGS